MPVEYARRPVEESRAERAFVEKRIAEVEKGMGALAARLGEPTPITQELDVLDRARELYADVLKQSHVRPLEESIAAHLAWLDRAEARDAGEPEEPRTALNRVALDRKLLQELLASWQEQRA